MSSIKSTQYKTDIEEGKSILYYNVSIDQHIETKKEINNLQFANQLNKIKKAKFKYVYKQFLEQYEDYINQNTFLDETSLINFYDFTNYFSPLIEKNKNVNPALYYTNSLEKNSKFSTNNNKYFLGFENINYKSYALLKNMFPFYMEIIFDKIFADDLGLNNLFDSYSVKQKILELYESNVGDLIINNEFFINNNLSNKVDFYTKLNSTKLKFKYSNNDILNGIKSPYEVLGYKISKFYSSSGYSTPIQEWFISAGDANTLEIIDTQIKFNTNYYYSISTIIIVAGCSYDNEGGDIYNISNELIVTEIESCEYEGRMVTPPPISPGVLFVPINGIHNKIKIFLSPNLDKIIEKPIPIFYPEDTFIYDALIDSEFYDENGDIHFETIIANKNYEMMRLDKEPKSYSDFANGKLVIFEQNSSTFIDDISVNKKYYYIFRSVDKHNMISNPTKIFTLEMIQNSGIIYPIFGIHEINDNDSLKESKKSFKKFFSFAPQINNTYSSDDINIPVTKDEERDIMNSPRLLSKSSSVWGKKFKIRLTSKSTGKKIDFNIFFNRIIDKQK